MKSFRPLVLTVLTCAFSLSSLRVVAGEGKNAHSKGKPASPMTSGQQACVKGFNALIKKKSDLGKYARAHPADCHEKVKAFQDEQTHLPIECTHYHLNDFPEGAIDAAKLLSGGSNTKKQLTQTNPKASEIFSKSVPVSLSLLMHECDEAQKMNSQTDEKVSASRPPITGSPSHPRVEGTAITSEGAAAR